MEVQDTSRHYGFRYSKHRWPKVSLVVDTVGEAVTTGLYICEFLMFNVKEMRTMVLFVHY